MNVQFQNSYKKDKNEKKENPFFRTFLHFKPIILFRVADGIWLKPGDLVVLLLPLMQCKRCRSLLLRLQMKTMK